MSVAPNPHSYLSCEEAERYSEKYRMALERIVERACNHCSAWEIACGATGRTFLPQEAQPSSEERLLDKYRRDILRLRDHINDCWTTDGFVPVDPEAVLADTEHYEAYR